MCLTMLYERESEMIGCPSPDVCAVSEIVQ